MLKNLSLFLLISSFVSIEGKILKTNDQEKFVAAVYEHKPITALPICYEMGKCYNMKILESTRGVGTFQPFRSVERS